MLEYEFISGRVFTIETFHDYTATLTIRFKDNGDRRVVPVVDLMKYSNYVLE